LTGGATRSIRQIQSINQGQIGVQMFMVISGFILAIISYDKELSAPRFYLNCALRIYPLFLVVLALGYFATPDPRPTSTTIDFLIARFRSPTCRACRTGNSEDSFGRSPLSCSFTCCFRSCI
jgi:peptidoglycan/LPS O-acetylase OafA/YrhL